MTKEQMKYELEKLNNRLIKTSSSVRGAEYNLHIARTNINIITDHIQHLSDKINNMQEY